MIARDHLAGRTHSFGECVLQRYNATYGEPVWDDTSQHTGGWWQDCNGFQKGKHVAWSAFTKPAWVKEQTGYGRNSAGPERSHSAPIDFRVGHFSEKPVFRSRYHFLVGILHFSPTTIRQVDRRNLWRFFSFLIVAAPWYEGRYRPLQADRRSSNRAWIRMRL